MKTIFQRVIFIIGILLILYSIFMAIISNFNIGILATLTLGIFFISSVKFYKWLDHFKNKWLIKIVKYMILAMLSFVFVIITMLVFVGQNDTTKFDENALIVLGSGIKGETVLPALKNKLDKAIEYWLKNPNSMIIVSGGQGPQEDISEALAMKRYLLKNNVPEDIIIMEDKSTSTYENFAFSKKTLDDLYKENYSVAYITNDFYIYRAGKIANLAGLKSMSFSAKTQWYTIPTSYLRETIAILKSWVFGYM